MSLVQRHFCRQQETNSSANRCHYRFRSRCQCVPPPPTVNPIDDLPDIGHDDRPPKKHRDEDDEDRPRKKHRDEDDEDDRPRKKRRDDDEEDDDRPRKKRRDGDDPDDDDRPRKKRRDEDDEDDDRPRKKRRDDDEDDDDRGRRSKKKKKKPKKSNMVMILALAGGGALLLLIVGVVVFMFASGGVDMEAFLKEDISCYQDMTAILDTVKDKTSAKAAVPRIDAIKARKWELMKQEVKIRAKMLESLEEWKRMEKEGERIKKKYETEEKAAHNKYFEAEGRARSACEGEETFKKALNKWQSGGFGGPE